MNDHSASTATLAAEILDAARNAGMRASEVRELKRLSGGASKETWAFTLALEDGSVRELVLRRQPSGQRFASQGLSSVSGEARIIRFAAKAGLPVPQVHFELPSIGDGGDGYVMDRVEGETVGTRVLKLPELQRARAGMARRCGEILANLHTASGFEQLGLKQQGTIEAIAGLEDRLRRTGQDRPVFEFALTWLKTNLADSGKRVLLHGDFRNGNLMVGPEGIRAVLDWELAFVGPPVYDLAWLCVTSWRFQRPELPVGGFGTREELIEGYEAAGGQRVDRAELRAWEVFQTMNWGVMCVGAGVTFVEGNRTVEGAVIARRSSETEFDLMRLLAPDHEAWNAG